MSAVTSSQALPEVIKGFALPDGPKFNGTHSANPYHIRFIGPTKGLDQQAIQAHLVELAKITTVINPEADAEEEYQNNIQESLDEIQAVFADLENRLKSI